MYDLQEKNYQGPSGIDVKYYLPDSSQTETMDILVVSFSGVYPDGSRGNEHGAYIAIQTMFGLHAFDPDCIVLDFRNLEYRWGNTLLRVFQDISDVKDADKEEEEPFFPVLAVTSERCEAAFLSLVTPSGQENQIGVSTVLIGQLKAEQKGQKNGSIFKLYSCA